MNEDVYLLYFALSWEEHEKMCAADTSEIFKDGPSSFEKRISVETSLKESEDTCQSISEEEGDDVQMQDQVTVQNHDLMNEGCEERNIKKGKEFGQGSFIQDQEQMNEQSNEEKDIDDEQNTMQLHDAMEEERNDIDTELGIQNLMDERKYNNIKSEVFDDSLIKSYRSINVTPSSNAAPVGNDDQPNKNLSFPLMNDFTKQSSQKLKTTLQNIASDIVPEIRLQHDTEISQSLPLATDKVTAQQGENCFRPNEDESLRLPLKLSCSINKSSHNPKTITSDALSRMNYGTENLPPLPPGVDEIATQQEWNSETPPSAAWSKFSFQIVKTSENKLSLKKCDINSNQQKNPTRHPRAHLEDTNECHICKKMFRKKADLRNHLDKEHSYREFGCDQCGKRFRTNWRLTQHLKIHFAESHFKCELCDKIFKQKLYLSNHMLHIHNQPLEEKKDLDNINECHICKQIFGMKADLRNHLDKEHSYREFGCEQCGKRFKTSLNLKDHMQTHSTERRFQCELCDKGCRSMFTLRTHMFVHTKKSKHICVPCNKYFCSNSTLKIHTKMHHTAERPFKCSICNKGFVTTNKLKRHLSVHSDERPYKCSICEKSYKTKGKLKEHEYAHKDREKTIPCDFCDKMFTVPSLMKEHCRQVHLEKEFKCEQCGKKFVRESELKDHQFIHKGEKPHKCELCGKCFQSKDYFSLHKADHLNENAWKCEKCSKAFKRKDHLQKHMLTHSDYKPFECDVCKKTFNRKYNLKVHSKVHTEEYEQKMADRKKVSDQRNNGRKKKKVDDTDGENIGETSDVPRAKRSSRKKNVVCYKETNEDEDDCN